MNEKGKSILINIGVGAVLTVLVVALNWQKGYHVTHLLCDGFFVAAVALLGVGGLKFSRNQGTFDMLSYSVSSTFVLHFPFFKKNSPPEERQESFVDYRERKSAKRKPAADLLWAGLIYLVLAFIMLAAENLLFGS